MSPLNATAVVGHVLAEVALDHVDAGVEQRLVRVAPQRERGGIGEVDDAAFAAAASARCRTGSTSRRRHPRRTRTDRRRRWSQQVAARRELLEQRRVDRHVRILPHADPQAVRLDRGERGRADRGSAAASHGKSKRVSTSHAARPSSVSTSHGNLALAQLRGDVGRLVAASRSTRATPTARGSSAAPPARGR